MADVRPLRGVRFRGEHEHHLGHRIAPPYDVGSADLLARLRDLSPYNMVHLEHVAPGDQPADHAAAAARYRAWLRDGVLAADASPAFYRYDQEFAVGERRFRRRGLFARVRLAAWDERIVRPHEATFARARLERQHHLAAVRANLSPLFLLYRDPSGELQSLLDRATGSPLADTEDLTGGTHRLTRLDEPSLIARTEAFFRDVPLYVADGHHRYEAALAHRDERRAAGPPPALDSPEEFVLACLVAADDPGLLVLPTHRLIHGLPAFDPVSFRGSLTGLFDLRRCPLPPATSDDLLDLDSLLDPGSDVVCVAVFAGEADAWQLRVKPQTRYHMPERWGAGGERMPLRAAERPGDAVAAITLVDAAVVEHALGLAPDRAAEHLRYQHDSRAALAALARGEAQVAFLVRPPAICDLLAVADAGRVMPAKSTYFHPKIPAGLILHDLT